MPEPGSYWREAGNEDTEGCVQVFDNSEGFSKLKRFDLRPGAIKTISYSFAAHEYQGKWYNQIDAWDVVPADESLLNTPDA